ncbi:hypothetical protein ILUMI_26522 [Ignelater luminosus]|uniref:Chitin deacetylase n=1 Tax=Ignelater luminosus TaxID=2038154 RepID=A0A8K0FVX1_IGNLU|nr:hypothetical protein ILUMI_26522 [Ignelater luminosus]
MVNRFQTVISYIKMKIILLSLFCVSVALAYPNIRAEAEKCTPDKCSLKNNCACSSDESPIGDLSKTPQFVTLTFDDSVNANDHDTHLTRLLFNRKNADGSPAGASFYIPHQYTDYSKVNNLYNKGFDIGVNSITKGTADYFANATVNTLVDEFNGQRVILSTFANIPIGDIQGVRTPHFEIAGDRTFEAYIKSGLKYDNSMPTNVDQPFYPYTTDYKSTQPCIVAKCPTSSFAGFWVHPIINLLGDDEHSCNVLFGCNIESSSAVDVRDWLIKQFERHYKKTKAPQTFLVNSAFFLLNEHALDGLELFLNHLGTLKDTFLVSHREVNRWVKNPVPLDQYKPLVESRNAECKSRTCALQFGEHEIRYMVSCVTCPDEYPWIGNPKGD